MAFADILHIVFNHRFLSPFFSFDVTLYHLHDKKYYRAVGDKPKG